MNMLSRGLRSALLLSAGFITWQLLTALAAAQYYPVAPPGAPLPGAPVFPAVPGYGFFPYGGGYWNGQAAMLDAYGNVGLDQEQARVVREQANQARLDTKKKVIDTMQYERAHEYWYTDEKVDTDAKRVQAAMNNPPVQEITSGRALNTLLPFLDKLSVKGTGGGPIPIDPAILKQINTSSGADAGNAGLLREVGNLQWPVATLGPSQQKLDEMLKKATYDGAKGPVSPVTISQLKKQTELLAQDVKQKFFKNEIDSGDYLQANRFLDRVRQANAALSQPDISRMLAGAMGPQGDTVDQVVQSMAGRGLTFAAAQPGEEGAYLALYRAFVNYGLNTSTPDTGFRVRLSGQAGVTAKQ
jgi:hypothetical protein